VRLTLESDTSMLRSHGLFDYPATSRPADCIWPAPSDLQMECSTDPLSEFGYRYTMHWSPDQSQPRGVAPSSLLR
jgi:hypothetical protein